jgi:hypothetical protein
MLTNPLFCSVAKGSGCSISIGLKRREFITAHRRRGGVATFGALLTAVK